MTNRVNAPIWGMSRPVKSPVGEALDSGAEPGLEVGGGIEFGTQDSAAGRDAEDEGVDRGGSAVGVRVVEAALA